MHRIVIWYFLTLRSDHRLSDDLSPYKVITILLTIFPMLYISSSWLNFFCNWKFAPLNLPHISPHLPPMAATCLFSVSISLFLFCYVSSFVLFLRFHIYVKLWYLSFSVWLILLSMIPLGPFTLSQMVIFHSFLLLSYIPLYIHITFIHSSINGHLGCFHISYCKYCCKEHRGAYIFSN